MMTNANEAAAPKLTTVAEWADEFSGQERADFLVTLRDFIKGVRAAGLTLTPARLKMCCEDAAAQIWDRQDREFIAALEARND